VSYECWYFGSDNGRSPVEAFIDGLSQKTQRKFFTKIKWLEEYGPRLVEPHAKKIEEDLYSCL